jgi:hypothetical protein
MAKRKRKTTGRPKGAKNRTSRELRAEAKRLMQIATLQERLDRLRKKKANY